MRLASAWNASSHVVDARMEALREWIRSYSRSASVDGLQHSEPLIRFAIEMGGVSSPPPMPSVFILPTD